MRIRFIGIIIILGAVLISPRLLSSQYYFQLNGGYISTGIQDAASSRNIFWFLRQIVDLSPVRWNIRGPEIAASFHMEGNTFHHHLVLEYYSAQNGHYQKVHTQVQRPEDSRLSLRARYRMDQYLLKNFLVSRLDFAFGPQVFILWENTDRILGGEDRMKFSGRYFAPSFLLTLRYRPLDEVDIKMRLSTGGILGWESIRHPRSGTRDNDFFVNGWRTSLDISLLWYFTPRAGIQLGWSRFSRMEGGTFSSRLLEQSVWRAGIRCRIGETP